MDENHQFLRSLGTLNQYDQAVREMDERIKVLEAEISRMKKWRTHYARSAETKRVIQKKTLSRITSSKRHSVKRASSRR